MVAGNWSIGDNNIWKYYPDKGRVNDAHSYTDKDVAYKYWFHELGHAHGLHHRDEWGGQLMDSGDLTAMSLNKSECEEWNAAYDLNASSTETVNHDHSHDNGGSVTCGPTDRTSTDVDMEKLENKSVTRPTVEKKEEL